MSERVTVAILGERLSNLIEKYDEYAAESRTKATEIGEQIGHIYSGMGKLSESSAGTKVRLDALEREIHDVKEEVRKFKVDVGAIKTDVTQVAVNLGNHLTACTETVRVRQFRTTGLISLVAIIVGVVEGVIFHFIH